MKQGLALSIIGLSIGWLTGLSVSPVIGIVITSIMGIVAAGIAVLQEIQHVRSARTTASEGATASRSSSSAILVATLSCTTALGATAGVWARTHDLLAPTEIQNFHRWTQLGIPDSVVRDRLFQSQFKLDGEAGAPVHESVLFSSISSNSCAELAGLEGDSLRNTARAATDKRMSTLAEEFDSPTLAKIVGIICGQR